MVKYLKAKCVSMAEVTVGRVAGRLRLGWIDGVKVALGSEEMTMEVV